MPTPATAKVLAEALKLSVEDRVRIAEELLASAADDESADDARMAETLERRSRELRDGSVRGLTVEEARRAMLSDDEP
jgi:putative addiction module component (TIGR02574 family)